MDPREELQALRRMAELEARSGGQSQQPSTAPLAAPTDEPSFMDRLLADLKSFPRNMGRALGVAGAGITEGVAAPVGLVADFPFNVASKLKGEAVTTPTQELSNRFDQMLGPETKGARQVVGIAPSMAINPFAGLPGMGPAVADLTGKTGAQIVANKGANMGLKVNPADPNLEPSRMTRILGALSNRAKFEDQLSRGNQGAVDSIVRNAAELQQGEPLTRKMVAAAATRIGNNAYGGARTGGAMAVDQPIIDAAADPAVARILKMKLGSLGDAESAKAVDAWKEITADARGAWSAATSGSFKPSDKSRAKTLDAAADALKSWIDRNLRAKGMTDVADDFVTAPSRIAQSHTLSDAVIPGANATNASVLARALDNNVPMQGQPRTLAEFATVFPGATRSPIAPQPNVAGAAAAAEGNIGSAAMSQMAGGSPAAAAASGGRAFAVTGIPALSRALLRRENLQRAATGQEPLPTMFNDKEAQARAILAWLSSQENR